MKKMINRIFSFALLVLAFGCNGYERINASKVKLTYISNDVEYHAAIDSLLNDNYNFYKNEDAKRIIGEIEDSGVYAGPFYGKYHGKEYIALTKRDSRAPGYSKDRCFVFIKKKADMYDINKQTSVFEKPCWILQKFDDRAEFPRIKGYNDISEEGKELLTQLAGQSWMMRKNIKYLGHKTAYDEVNNVFYDVEVTKEVSWTSSFNFNVHDDFKKIDLDMNLHRAQNFGTFASFTPTNTDVVRLQERKLDDGKIEILLWMNRPWFMYQDARKLSLYHLNRELMNAGDEILRVDNIDFFDFHCTDYSYMVLSYDPQNAERLDVSFHLMDVDHYERANREPLKITYYIE